jgi:hypothetical protein
VQEAEFLQGQLRNKRDKGLKKRMMRKTTIQYNRYEGSPEGKCKSQEKGRQT